MLCYDPTGREAAAESALARIPDVQASRPKAVAIVLLRFTNSRAHQRDSSLGLSFGRGKRVSMGRFRFLFLKSFRLVPLFAVAAFCCMALMSAAAFAGISSKRTGTDTTPTASGAAAVPANVSGQAGVATTSPATGGEDDNKAGTAKAAETGNEACTTANLGQIRYNAALGYVEVCTTR
jgi:hypothetical protein